MKKNFFTLIELLVVIAIIGILASILMPVLGKARQKAILASCTSNYKQYNTALYMFGDDYNNQTPPGGKMTGGQWDPAEATNSLMVAGKAVGHIENLALYMGVNLDTTSIATIEESTLNESIMKGFICPADDDVKDTFSVNLGGYYGFIAKHNFGTNDAMYSQENTVNFANELSNVVYPSQTVTVFEPEVQFTNTARLWSNGNRPSILEWALLGSGSAWGAMVLTDRHQGKMNVSFVDGHVGILDNKTNAGMAEAYLNYGL
ncbi:prepilin-type N-terminal cleavage/methylation domain-containing protein [Lentisphaera profundi]|uniref:Prepilin-type N-terminal cleavage/methylation domain-containing protein n=1 Tax=Lentisphaera profundi TaxID=1658616 RepID=A0ABY7VR52_9BACT|nr:prepilin-type N-terminal cleavage/methylation domain-containing protein [Lentisphaera profundi]WDE96172.1 prepilin-type N-terminal cleavage/methylation domain-containing protein [Lentisphaera profundi]